MLCTRHSKASCQRILDEKLYLNYNTEVQKKWLDDKENYIIKANENWLTLDKDVN